MNRNVRVLSERECKIIALMSEGYTNRQIAEQLSCSSPSVEKSLESMQRKLGVGHLYQLISWAYLEGVLK